MQYCNLLGYLLGRQHTVMAVRGVDARRAFYDDKGFSFNQGYIILMGGVRHLIPLCAPSLLMTPENVIDRRQESTTLTSAMMETIVPSSSGAFQSFCVKNGYRTVSDFSMYMLPVSTNLVSVIPVLLNDIHCRMTAWGEEGTIDPFNKVYDVRYNFFPT